VDTGSRSPGTARVWTGLTACGDDATWARAAKRDQTLRIRRIEGIMNGPANDVDGLVALQTATRAAFAWQEALGNGDSSTRSQVLRWPSTAERAIAGQRKRRTTGPRLGLGHHCAGRRPGFFLHYRYVSGLRMAGPRAMSDTAVGRL